MAIIFIERPELVALFESGSSASDIVWKTVKVTYPDTEHVKFKTLLALKVASCMVKETQNPDEFVTEVCYAVR